MSPLYLYGCVQNHCVHYIVTMPFCSAVQMSCGNYYTLYSGLKVSHNALRKVVYN